MITTYRPGRGFYDHNFHLPIIFYRITCNCFIKLIDHGCWMTINTSLANLKIYCYVIWNASSSLKLYLWLKFQLFGFSSVPMSMKVFVVSLTLSVSRASEPMWRTNKQGKGLPRIQSPLLLATWQRFGHGSTFDS